MELICPSCEARYAIPDGSIGEKGRQVSCMNCGHGWHAFPPLVLGAAQAAVTPSGGMQWRHTERGSTAPPSGIASWQAPSQPVVQAPGAGTAPPPLEEPHRSVPERATTSRSEQLAELREMLAEVQSEDRAAETRAPAGGAMAALRTPQPDPDEARAGAGARERPAAETTRVAPEFGDADDLDSILDDPDARDRDPLRRRMEMYDESTAPKRKDVQQTAPTDVRRLRRKHDRKTRHKRGDEAGSGAFLTGFLLMAIVASVMIALYLLHPQIIAQVPSAEQPLIEYVAAIDGLRVSVEETYQGISGWVRNALSSEA